jgi:hypothetical protein
MFSGAHNRQSLIDQRQPECSVSSLSSGGAFYIFHILHSPKLLINVGGAQSLRLGVFKSVLIVQNQGSQLHRKTEVVCAVDRVRRGVFDVSVCVVEPAFVAKQLRQFVMNPKQEIVPIERGCDSEGYLEMVNRLLGIALGSIYVAEKTMRFADPMFFALLWEEIERAECGFFCGIELFV